MIDINAEQMREILQDVIRPLSDSLKSLEKRIETMDERTNKSIHDAIENISEIMKEHSVLESKFVSHENRQDKDIAEIKISLDSNWTKTREIELKIIKWAGIATGLSLAGSSVASKFL